MKVSLTKEEWEVIQACLMQSADIDFLPETIKTIKELLAGKFSGIVMKLRVIRS